MTMQRTFRFGVVACAILSVFHAEAAAASDHTSTALLADAANHTRGPSLVSKTNEIGFNLAKVEAHVISLEEYLFPGGEPPVSLGCTGGEARTGQEARRGTDSHTEEEARAVGAAHTGDKASTVGGAHTGDGNQCQYTGVLNGEEDAAHKWFDTKACKRKEEPDFDAKCQEQKDEARPTFSNLANGDCCPRCYCADDCRVCKSKGLLDGCEETSSGLVSVHTEIMGRGNYRQHVETQGNVKALTTHIGEMEKDLNSLQDRIFCVEKGVYGKGKTDKTEAATGGLIHRASELYGECGVLSVAAEDLMMFVVGAHD